MNTDLTLVSNHRVLTADDLGIGVRATLERTHASNAPDAPALEEDDEMLVLVQRLLPAFGGVLFSGPPGTGKTFTASQIAERLAGSRERLRFVQFHASYQYDDFIEGFVPSLAGGFERKSGVFKQLCEEAAADPDNTYVLVIDELSRADAARVFGEALTYVERSKRGLSVSLASGTSFVVPENVEILATMNPVDRGVDEVDAAFERRFAKIKVEPRREILHQLLRSGGLEDSVANRVLGWFSMVNGLGQDNPSAFIGHAYFINIDGIAALRDVWDFQIQFAVDRAFRLDPENRSRVETGWRAIFNGVDGGWDGTQPASPSNGEVSNE